MEVYTETFRIRYQKNTQMGWGVIPKWEDITEEEYLMFKMSNDEKVIIRKIAMVPTEKEVELERVGPPQYGVYGGGVISTALPIGVPSSFTYATSTGAGTTYPGIYVTATCNTKT